MTDVFVLLILIWLIVGTGVLFYFPPASLAAKKMRQIICAAIGVSVLFLAIHTDVPMTAKEAVIEVGLPFGRPLLLPYRYGYSLFLFRFLPLCGLVGLFTATFGPIAYVFKTRRDSRH